MGAKKAFLFVAGSLFFLNNSISQKPPLDTAAFRQWEKIVQRRISDDGKFIAYTADSDQGKRTTITSPGQSPVFKNFSTSSPTIQLGNEFGLIRLKDSLLVINLYSKSVDYINKISSYKFNNKFLLAYQPKQESNLLHLRNLHSGKESLFENILDYFFAAGDELLLLRSTDSTGDSRQELVLVNVENGNRKVVWIGNKARNFVFDPEHSQWMFASEQKENNKTINCIWVYSNGQKTARQIFNDLALTNYDSLKIERPDKFSRDGRNIFFVVRNNKQPLVSVRLAKLDVWNYKDEILPSQQMFDAKWGPNGRRLFFLNIQENKVIQLTNDTFQRVYIPDNANAKFLLVTSTYDNLSEAKKFGWSRESCYMVSLEKGQKRRIINKGNSFMISPSARYVVWYDRDASSYFSYDVSTGTSSNISKRIPSQIYDDQFDWPEPQPPFGIAGWIAEKEAIMIYDRYDIWSVSLDGSQMPVSLTHQFGKKNNHTLRVLNFYDPSFRVPLFHLNDNVILKSFSNSRKNCGFYRLHIGNKELAFLSTDNYYYDTDFRPPLKSAEANVYLISRMNTKQPEDIYVTTDFKSFSQVSHINEQQKNYNWVTSELVKWKSYNGEVAEGILYKPENFDPTKRYPVIFYFYEILSNGLLKYPFYESSEGWLPVSYFVSNGYVVFMPDIKFATGYPGKSVYNYVVSAAKFLSKKSWVDSARIGIQGHSWGGYEVADLITRTTVFKAACAAALQANFISGYNNVRDDGVSRQFHYETGQNRIGATLWQRPDLYFENSPILRAQKVVTPLLIMHNEKDGVVPFTQGLEYFLGLRRLNKKVWLLQYDGEGHSLSDNENRLDFTVRMKQFFDHYLKGTPAPVWMTLGIPYKYKQIESRYELDPVGNCGKECKVCKMWSGKYKKDLTATIKEVKQMESRW